MSLGMRILTRADVESLLDLDRLVDTLAEAMADLSAGRASMPPRVAALTERKDVLGAMPGYIPSLRTLATKLVSVFPENARRGLHTHHAIIAVFDPDTGVPVAMMDGTYITARRTAACSALATRLLAREGASVLAVLGTGVQAHAHAAAVPRVRPIREMRVAGRDRGKAEQFARELSGSLRRPVDVAGSFEEAIRGADIVCACTHSPQPIVRWEWLSPGTHINSVGMNAEGPEVDPDVVANSLVVVESRASALSPFPAGARDLVDPIQSGVITEDHVHAEIGELVLGTKPGRTSSAQVTLYKSVGVAVQDAAAAALVLDAAIRRGIGIDIDL